jgi:hypothetical protein
MTKLHAALTFLPGLLLFPVSLLCADSRELGTGFELHQGMIFLQASIGDSGPLQMALDSGTKRTTLDEALARKMGLDLSMKARSSGANGIQEISVVRDQTLGIGGVSVPVPLMLVYPLDFLSKKIGHRVDGIVGVELLRHFVVRIDYTNRQLSVMQPASFSYSGAGQVLPVTYHDGLPLVPGSLMLFGRDPIQTRFQLDTGSGVAYVNFWKAFVEKHQLLSGARELADTEMTGFGGSKAGKKGRIKALQIGQTTLPEPEVGFCDWNFGDPGVFGGNVGNRFFRLFNVIFDLPHDRLILEDAGAK